MNQLCRHILPAGRACQQPALHASVYCRHHQTIKLALKRSAPAPDPYGFHKPLHFAFPEDRAALQLNYFLVVQALNDNTINLQKANAFNRLFRSCEMNLSHGPLVESDKDNSVQRVILTPEGDEIAPPREQLEEGEAEPLHHKDCPCQRCAEQFRNATPEQHHQNCQCGLCEPATTVGAPYLEEMWEPQMAAQQSLPSHENGCPILDAPFAARVGDHESSSAAQIEHPRGQSRTATAEKLYARELTIDPANKEVSLYDYLYGDKHKQYEAQYAARARAAIEAGIEPLPYEPFDPKKIESEGMRRYKATMEEVEKNKQIAEEIWQRRFGDEDPQLSNTTELNP